MQSSSQIITSNKPSPNFLQAGCPSCHLTNSLSALKGYDETLHTLRFNGHFPGEPRLASCPFNSPLHLFLDCASSWDRPKLSMLFLKQSYQVFYGRPLCLIPSNSNVVQRLTKSLSSFCSTCPNHLNLLIFIIKLTGSLF